MRHAYYHQCLNAVNTAEGLRMATKHCVIYRTGGRDNFQWHRTVAMSHDEAMKARADIRNGGRIALVELYASSLRVGLPEGYTFSGGESA
jgi:hypothetical protein